MAKRELQEINAGSMADIAFLLLIFFLVTTTMATDQGINRDLAKKEENPPDVIVIKRNILEIQVNLKDQMAVEGKYITLDELGNEIEAFYANKRIDMPAMKLVSKAEQEKLLAIKKSQLSADPESKPLKNGVKKLEGKLQAIEYFGEYYELPKIAFISITTDQKSSYNRFIEIYNEIDASINKLRNAASLSSFNKPYAELDEKLEEDRDRIRALRVLYPKRVVTPELKAG